MQGWRQNRRNRSMMSMGRRSRNIIRQTDKDRVSSQVQPVAHTSTQLIAAS